MLCPVVLLVTVTTIITIITAAATITTTSHLPRISICSMTRMVLKKRLRITGKKLLCVTLLYNIACVLMVIQCDGLLFIQFFYSAATTKRSNSERDNGRKNSSDRCCGSK
jgi:hypothetical protein